MKVDPDRIESLIALKPPADKKELQQVIGIFSYVRSYVPNMSELMSPLYQLMRNHVVWQWLPAHNEAFNKLKVVVSTVPVLASFDPAKKITLLCDASQHGLGWFISEQ
jgi:hypothetical protein